MRSLRWNTTLAVAAALVVALAAAPAWAAEPPGAPKGPIGHLLRCLTIVDLTDAQKEQVRGILEAEKPVMQGLLQQLKTDADALKAALEASPQDPCAVGSAFLKVGADKAAIRAELQAVKADVEAVLTPEQVAKLNGCLQAPKDQPAEQAAYEGEEAEAWF